MNCADSQFSAGLGIVAEEAAAGKPLRVEGKKEVSPEKNPACGGGRGRSREEGSLRKKSSSRAKGSCLWNAKPDI